MPDDPLAEATALAETHFGPDPVTEAAVSGVDLSVPEPDCLPIHDPDAGQPYAVDSDHICRTLSAADPAFVIPHGGREFAGNATTFLAAAHARLSARCTSWACSARP